MIIAGIDPSINGSAVVKFNLDSNLDVIEKDYLSFTSVKKNSTDKIKHFRKKDFKNYIDQNIFMQGEIYFFVALCDYISIEDYAMAAHGLVFDIAEFCGTLKQGIYCLQPIDIKMRLYPPTVVKKFATKKGNADKVRMCDAYNEKPKDYIDLSFLPEYKSPQNDIVDAFWIVKLLQLELKLRHGLIQLKDLPLEHIEIFNSVSKKNKVNLLDRPFLGV